MSVCCAVLMCHAPIVIPAIAGAEANACKNTTAAMRKTARALLQHEPELVVLVSPHAPRRADSIGLAHDAHLQGDFARFGHPELAFSFVGAPQAAQHVAACADLLKLSTHVMSGQALDHGALVPLYFVHEAGYRGPVLLVSLPYPGAACEERLGHALREAAQHSGLRWAILASGDMSHRLQRGAPAGFHPRAREFDQTFVQALRNKQPERAVTPDPELVQIAAEDVVQSTTVALSAVQYAQQGLQVFSYEAPFGVGYLEALLFSERARQDDAAEESAPPRQLIHIARSAIDHALRGEPYSPPALAAPWDAARAVFVTLRSADGELRGCIGRTEPQLASLAEEVSDCAVGAALRDPRMMPVERAELPTLAISVSVLSPAQPVSELAELDPAVFGVVVRHGARRGVLLPDLEGVDTVSDQLRIALRKAGIAEDAPYAVERFRVQKVEADAPS